MTTMRARAPGWIRRIRNGDRKSTRLNSSHLVISYAVFCLKKKKQTDPLGDNADDEEMSKVESRGDLAHELNLVMFPAPSQLTAHIGLYSTVQYTNHSNANN